ncbi:MAG: CPBP family intramembrane glutamic endopeptidase [Candidatus Bathyarchaeia archaeon]|nr:CPBP family intramembrane metalloprotease [Candidatus Bathyarchaeota archaeon]
MNITKILLKIAEASLSAIITIIIVTYFFSIPLGFILMFLNNETASLIATKVKVLIIFFAIDFWSPLKINLGVLFSVLLLIYLLCLILSWRNELPFHKAILNLKLVFKNWLASMPLISSALLLTIIFLQNLQEKHGVPTGAIQFQNPYEALFSLAYSPIIEEIGFRISFIGLISMLYCLNSAKNFAFKPLILKISVLSFLYPDKAKQTIGLENIKENGWIKGIKLGEWLTVFLTSIGFGLAHYLAGSGWEVGKITSAFLAGLIFSLVYLRYGFHASILLHWFFNYYGYIYELAVEKNFLISIVLILINNLTVILGVLTIGFFVMEFINKSLQFIASSKIKESNF